MCNVRGANTQHPVPLQPNCAEKITGVSLQYKLRTHQGDVMGRTFLLLGMIFAIIDIPLFIFAIAGIESEWFAGIVEPMGLRERRVASRCIGL
jgi:hypothetical protein